MQAHEDIVAGPPPLYNPDLAPHGFQFFLKGKMTVKGTVLNQCGGTWREPVQCSCRHSRKRTPELLQQGRDQGLSVFQGRGNPGTSLSSRRPCQARVSGEFNPQDQSRVCVFHCHVLKTCSTHYFFQSDLINAFQTVLPLPSWP